MAVIPHGQLVDSAYPALFRSYIGRSVRYMLTQVQQHPVLSVEMRAQALHTLDYALQLADTWSDTGALLVALSPKMEQAGYREEWIPYLRGGIQRGQILEDIETTAALYLELGILYKLQGKYEAAQAYLEAGRMGFLAVEATEGQARAFNHLADVARREQQFEEATRLVKQALRLGGGTAVERGRSNLILGLISLGQRRWTVTVRYCQTALEIWQQQKQEQPRLLGQTLITLGAARQQLKEYSAALTIYQQALSLFKRVRDPLNRAIVEMNLGNVYLCLEQPEEALPRYLWARRVFHQLQDPFHLPMIYHNLGMAYRQLGQWQESEEMYQLSLQQKQTQKNWPALINTLDGLGLLYLAQGQTEKARTIFQSGLEQVSRLEEEVAYEYLRSRLTRHLKRVNSRTDDGIELEEER